MDKNSQQFKEVYDPRISTLIKNAVYGDPVENYKNLLHYEISPEFDKKAKGIDIEKGSYLMVIAPEKNRKTTLVLNLVLKFATQMRERGYWVCVDMLESGIDPETYRDMLICIAITRLMVADVFGNKRSDWPSPEEIVNHPELKDHLHLGYKELHYVKRTPKQQLFFEEAKKVVSSLPISVFGARKGFGRARSLELSMGRWEMLINGNYPSVKGLKHKLFIVDNIQQVSGYAASSHMQLETVVNAHSDFVAEEGITVIDVSQVSKGDRVEERDFSARGGTRGDEEAETVYEAQYDELKDPYHMVIKTNRARWGKPPTIRQPILPASGAFLGYGVVK